jgi:hypothetical protein
MPKILSHLQRDVISYVLAANEEREPPENSVAHFMRVFEGGFFPATSPCRCHVLCIDNW